MRTYETTLFTLMLVASTLALASEQEPMGEHMHMNMQLPIASTDPSITITINPEARVSVALGGALPPAARCDTPVELSVRVKNQGFVTSRLEATLVGDVPAGVALDFHPDPLKGVPEELRRMRITLTNPGLTDLTIAFRAHNEAPDLGGRDRVHFLMRCL